MLRRAGLVGALLLAAAPAGAGGTRLSGAVVLSLDDRGSVALRGDATARLDLTPRLGLDLGLFGQPLSPRHETYATLGLDLGPGRIEAGIPRPAHDRFGASILDRMLPQAAFGEAQVAATRSRLTWATLTQGAVQVGLSWRGEGWALSAHRVLDSDLTVASLGASWHLGGWEMAGAFEAASDGTRSARLTAARSLGALEVQGGVFSGAAPGQGDMAEAGAIWHAGPRLDLGAVAQVTAQGPDLGTLAASIALPSGRLGLGVTFGDGRDGTATLGLSHRF